MYRWVCCNLFCMSFGFGFLGYLVIEGGLVGFIWLGKIRVYGFFFRFYKFRIFVKFLIVMVFMKVVARI